jgi:hypothetical protein
MADRSPPKLELRFQDVPELSETFAGSVAQWHFDNSTVDRFSGARFDEVKSPDTRTVRKLPVSRLVLTATGAVNLLNQCRRITAAMKKAGLVSGKEPAAAKQPN